MTLKDDRLSLSVSNWIGLAALSFVPLGAVLVHWADSRVEAAVIATEVKQIRADVADLKAVLLRKGP